MLLLSSLLGCGSSGRAPVEDRYGQGKSAVKVYQVQRGDTLYSIAFRYGLDYRKVAQVNSIPDPYIIYPGQHLYLWQVASSPVIVAPPPQTPVPVVSNSPGLPALYTPSPVIVTAVPGMAVAPVSQVAMPSTPVYQGGAAGSGANVAASRPSVPAQTSVAGTAPKSTSQANSTSSAPVVATAPLAAPRPKAAPKQAHAPKPGAKVTSWRWPSNGGVTRRYSSSVHKGVDIGGDRGDPIYAVADGTVVYAGTGIVGFGELIIIKHNDIYISAYGHNSRLLVRENDIVGASQLIAEKGSSGTDTVKLHFEIRKEGKPVDPLKLLPRR